MSAKTIVDLNLNEGKNNMIPKIVHYCWFGGNPLAEDAKKCIVSWKKYFPDYEIKEWNESNFDVNCNAYVKEAYDAGKWAFVSDYARFDILYKYGGIYFDTDVEVIKSFDDILARGGFMGQEVGTPSGVSLVSNQAGLGIAVNPGLGIAVAPGLQLYKEILDYYNSLHFIKGGVMDTTTICTHITEILKKHGYDEHNKVIQEVAGITVYPPEYFCPLDYATGKLNITSNTRSIHWYTASWQSSYSKFKTKLQHLLGPDITEKIIKAKGKLKEMAGK